MSTAKSPVLAETEDSLVQEHLDLGRNVCFTVTTASMYPMLSPGDKIMIRGVSHKELQIGDIIVLRSNSAWLAHRLIGFNQTSRDWRLITKGDSTPTADAITPEWKLCGVTVSIFRNGHEIDCLTNRARWMGGLIAFLSHTQGQLFRASPSVVRRVVLKVNRVILRLIAVVARWIIEW